MDKFRATIKLWELQVKTLLKKLKRKKFVYGTMKTKEQMKNELVKLKSRQVKKNLRYTEFENTADDVLYKMQDVANLAMISAVLNWCMGRLNTSPVDLQMTSIKQRRKNKEKGREFLLTKWLENNHIDKSYLEAIIKKVADGEVNKT